MAINGTAEVTSEGELSYTPFENYIGTDSFVVEVTDSGSPAASTELIVVVETLENHAPVLTFPTIQTEQGATVTATLKFDDVDTGQELTIEMASLPSNGIATLSSQGNLVYRPDPGFYGDEIIDIVLKDNAHPSSVTTAELVIKVFENKPPTIFLNRNNIIASPGLETKVIYFSDDINRNQIHAFTIPEGPSHGTATLSNGVLTYVGDIGYFGEDELTIAVTDNGVPAKSAFVKLNIKVEVNHPPMPIFHGNTTTAGLVRNIYIDKNDPDEGQKHTYSVSQYPSHGTLTSDPFWPHSFQYLPNAGYIGNDQFKIVVSDNGNPIMSNEVLITMTVNSNSAPVIENMVPVKLAQNGSTAFYIRSSDIDGDGIIYTLESTPTLGKAKFVGSLFSYEAFNQSGTETIQIRATDTGVPSQSTVGQLIVTVDENHAPAPVNATRNVIANEMTLVSIAHNDRDQGQIFTYSIVSSATNGTVKNEGGGSFSYRPNQDFVGEDEFTIRVTDNGTPAMSGEATVYLSVQQNYSPSPIASDIRILQNQLGITRIDPNDPNTTQRHSYSILSMPTNADNIRVDNQGFVVYQPKPNFFGQDQVVVSVLDSGTPPLVTSIAISIDVQKNLPPASISTNLSVFQGKTLNFNVSPNDPNTAPQFFNYQVERAPANGTINGGGGQFSYRPAFGFSGIDSFTVKVTDSGTPSLSGIQTFNVTVIKNTNPIVIASDTITTFQSTPVTINASFSDPDADQSHSFTVVENGTKGWVSVNNFGEISYSPYGGLSGEDSFVIGVQDSATPAGIGTKRINVSITPNSNPIVIANNISTFQSTAATTQVSFTDADAGQSHTYFIQTNATNGWATINQEGLLRYTPNFGFSGSDAVTVGVYDSASPAGIGTKVISINVQANTTPIVIAQDISVFQGAIGTVQIDFTDSDVGQEHTYGISVYPQFGYASIDTDGVLSYQPFSICNTAEDSLKVFVRDNASPAGVGEKTIRIITSPNHKPVVGINDLAIKQRDEVSGTINVTDEDPNETFTYELTGGSQFGTTTVSQNGTFIYKHHGPESLMDTFQVTVKDRFGVCGGQEVHKIVSVSIEPNHNPVLTANNISLEQNTPFPSRISATDIDTSQKLNYVIFSPPTKGYVTLNSETGDYSFIPFEGQVGADQFTVRVFDDGFPFLGDEKTVQVNIVPLNFPPVPTAMSLALLNGKTATTQVFANDPSVDQTHTFEILNQLQFGWASVTNNGLVTYHAFEGMEGFEYIQIKVTDNGQFPRSATFDIPVEVVRNLAPAPGDIIAQTVEGMSVTSTINANDPNHLRFPQIYSFRIGSDPAYGTATINESGTLTYNAPVGFAGTVNFTVEVLDQGTPALIGTSNITITVLGNEAPIVLAANWDTFKNVPIQKQVTFTDANSSQQTFAYSITSNPTNGNAVINSNGVVSYSPNLNYVGVDQLTIRVTDNGNPALYGEATMTINVQASSNTPPTMASLSFVTANDTLPKKYEFTVNNLVDDGTVKEVRVDFGDGTDILVLNNNEAVVKGGESSFARFNHNYFELGTYQVRLTFIDDQNAQSQYVVPVIVQTNVAPIANINYSPMEGGLPLNLVADASASTDPDGTLTTLCLNISKNGQFVDRRCNTSGLIVNYQFTDVGIYNINGCVTDNKRTYSCYSQLIYAGVDRPTYAAHKAKAVIQSSVRKGIAPLNGVILNGSQSVGLYGAPIASYHWTIKAHVTNSADQNLEQFYSGINPTVDFAVAGVYDISLLVIDQNGNEGTATTKIYVEEVASAPLSILALYQGDNAFQFKVLTFGQQLASEKSFWEFADGTIQRGFEAFKTLTNGEVHQVKFISFDPKGNKVETLKIIDLSTLNAQAPIIDLASIPNEVQVNQSFNLNASATSDSSDPQLRFRWWLGDGSTVKDGIGVTAANINHTYTSVGPKLVRLVATNSNGISSEMTFEINAISGVAPTFIASVSPKTGLAPLLLNGNVQANDPDGTIVSYTWNIHSKGLGKLINGSNFSSVLATIGEYRISLTIQDNSGNVVSHFVDTVFVNEFNKAPVVASTILNVPQNKKLTYDLEFSDEDEVSQLHSFSIVTGPTNGTATLSEDGRLVYFPNTDFLGTDTVLVRVTDNSTVPAFGEATITIQVTGDENLNPVLTGLGYNYDQNSFPRRTFFGFTQLTDPDCQIVKMTWDFGEGSTPVVIESHQINDFSGITHVYKQGGTYTTLVTAEDNKGGVTTASVNVVMAGNAMPVPKFTIAEAGSGPITLTLDATTSTDSNNTIVRYCWVAIKDGAQLLNACGTNPIQTVNVPTTGPITLSLSVRDSSRGNTSYQTNYNVGGLNDFVPYVFFDTTNLRRGASPLSIAWTSGSTYAFSGKTIVKKYWSLSDWLYSDNFLTGGTPTGIYKFPGTHATAMTAIDSAGKMTTQRKFVYVGADIPLQADFSATEQASNQVSFNAADWTKGHYIDFFLWDFGDATFGYGQYINHTYNKPGKYKVKLSVIDIHGQVNTKEHIVYVGEETTNSSIDGNYKLYTTINSPLALSVQGESDDIVKWNFGDGSVVSDDIEDIGSTMHSYAMTGAYRLRASVISGSTGFSRDFGKIIIVNNSEVQPQLSISNSSTAGSVPMGVTFNAQHIQTYSPASYLWVIKNEFGDIVHMTAEGSPSFTFTQLGNYFVSLTTKDLEQVHDYAEVMINVGSGLKKKNVPFIPKTRKLPMNELEIMNQYRKNYVLR